MKVAVIVYSLDIRGGTHKQVLRLCEYLKQQGVEVTIVTKAYVPEKTYPAFAEFKILTPKNKRRTEKKSKIGHACSRLWEDWELLRLIPKDADIINVHDMGMHLLIVLAKLTRKAKVVWQINDMPSCFMVGNSSGIAYEKKFEKQKRVFRYVAHKADRITVNVTKNKEHVVNGLKCDADVFYCGVDENPALSRHSAVHCAEELRILSTGVMLPYRNYETLITVVEKLNQQGVKTHLDIIGSAERNKTYATSIFDLVKKNALEKYVTIWGQVDEAKYAELYNSVDVFAFININQSWGLAVFEAMSCGLPVIVSNSVGAIELLHNMRDSIIVDPLEVDEICEVIKRLRDDSGLYSMISENAYNAVKQFTWDKLYSEKVWNLFLKLCGK